MSKEDKLEKKIFKKLDFKVNLALIYSTRSHNSILSSRSDIFISPYTYLSEKIAKFRMPIFPIGAI